MKLLEAYDEADRCVRVFEQQQDGSRLYMDGGVLYTHVDTRGGNLLEYIAAIERLVSHCENVLLLGTAGGALATALSRRGTAVTAVDDWAAAFEIARRWFHLPHDVECVHADAVAFLSATTRRWSGIVVDVFRGVDIPESMLTIAIGALLRRAAKPGGLVVWNVADAPSSPAARWVSTAFRAAGLAPHPLSILDPDVGNTLVVGRIPAT